MEWSVEVQSEARTDWRRLYIVGGDGAEDLARLIFARIGHLRAKVPTGADWVRARLLEGGAPVAVQLLPRPN